MPECVMEQVCAAEEEETGLIRLEPFVHQVGGHSSMLRFDDTTVCKPLNAREHNFYQSMPDEMKEFTPQYKGVTEVQFMEDGDGYLHLVAFPPSSKKTSVEYMLDQHRMAVGGSPASGGEGTQSDSDSETSSTSAKQRFRIRRSGSIEMEGGQTNDEDDVTSWRMRCHKTQLAKMRNMTGNQHKFLLLENLACDYKHPCILDLKMGTRQYGDDATEEKRRLQTEKCEHSTSSTLGARVCGMQSYQSSTGRYVCHDKYYGRGLDEQGMRDTLYQFLHSGSHLRRHVMAPISSRLRRLHAVISRHHTFRFYSCSLLIMYDGIANCNCCLNDRKQSAYVEQEEDDEEDEEEEDDSDSSMQYAGDEEEDDSDSRDSCTDHHHHHTRRVATNVAATAASSNSSSSTATTTPASSSSSVTEWSAVAAAAAAAVEGDDDSSWSCSRHDAAVATAAAAAGTGTGTAHHHRRHHHHHRPLVDVRLIDFAHTTHRGFRGDRIVHQGPDRGTLFGLENLIRLFDEIECEVSMDEGDDDDDDVDDDDDEELGEALQQTGCRASTSTK